MAEYYDRIPGFYVREETLQPTRTTQSWRDVVGLVSNFQKGDASVRSITSIDQAIRIYGDGNTEGINFIRAFLSAGGRELLVSRAVPNDGVGELTYSFAGVNPYLEPIVGYEAATVSSTNLLPDDTNYTTGLELKATMVSMPKVERSTFNPVDTKITKIDHATFKGRGVLRVIVTAFVDGDGTGAEVDSATVTLNTAVATTNDIQLVTCSKVNGAGNAIDEVLPLIKPGYVIGTGSVKLLILNSPVSVSDSLYGFMVKVVVGSTTASTLSGCSVRLPVTGSYICGYKLNVLDQLALTPYTADQNYFSLPNATYDDGYNVYQLDSFFALPAEITPGYELNFQYQVVANTDPSIPTKVSYENFGVESDTDLKDYGIRITFGATTSKLAFLKSSNFAIFFASTSIMVGGTSAAEAQAFLPGKTGMSILQELESAIYSNTAMRELIGDVDGSYIQPPFVFTLRTSLVGDNANRLYVTLNRYTEGDPEEATDLLVAPPASTAYGITGYGQTSQVVTASASPRKAYVDFYSVDDVPLIRVQASSPGLLGNQVKVSITPIRLEGGYAIFIVSYQDTAASGAYSSVKQLILNTREIDLATGLFKASEASEIQVYFLPIAEPGAKSLDSSNFTQLYSLFPLRTAPALGRTNSLLATGATSVAASGVSYVTDVFLAHGADPVPPGLAPISVRARGFYEGVKRLENQDIAMLVVEGIYYGDHNYTTVFDEAVKQVTNSSVLTGYRRLALTLSPGTSPAVAKSISVQLNSDRIALVVGHCTVRFSSGSVAKLMSPLAFYAAKSLQKPSQSPHYGYIESPNAAILATDAGSSYQTLKEYTQGQIEVLYYDSSSKNYRFFNGRSLSRLETETYISVRAIKDHLLTSIYNATLPYRGLSSSVALQRIAGAAQLLLTSLLNEGYLTRIEAPIVTQSPEDQVKGIIRLQIQATPTIPNDIIELSAYWDFTFTETIVI